MKRIALGVFFIISGIALLLAAAYVPGFASFYARRVYPFIVCVIGGFSGLFPFALSEFLLYFFLILLALYLARHIFHPLSMLPALILTFSILFFMYAACCGVNYRAETFSETIGLKVAAYSVEDLETLLKFLSQRVNENETKAEGASMFFDERREKSVEAMRSLAEKYDVLSGCYPLPKPVCCSELLSIQQVTGVYSPWTVEALYNRFMPSYNIPHTLCHELSHLKGFMPEDEANFIAFLACIGSDDIEFRYSGYLTAFVYAGRALSGADSAAYREIYTGLCDKAKADISENNSYWAMYDGPVARAQDEINDAYLRAVGDERGVLSYDHFTELMLAYFSPVSPSSSA